MCAHSEVSLQYSVNNPVNQSYASSAYIQMRAGFLHQARSILTCMHCLQTQNEHIRMCAYYTICVHVTLYVCMLIIILLHRDVTMSKFTCIESHVAMSVRCLYVSIDCEHLSVAQEGSEGCRWPKTSEVHTYRCAPTGE